MCTIRRRHSELERLIVAVLGLCALGCGRTEALWWADIYASDSGTEDQGDGDGDTIGTSSTGDDDATATGWMDTSDSDTAWDTSDTAETATTDTSTETTETTMGCEDTPVALSSDPPSVLFLIDQGAHMGQNYDGQTRWQAIDAALFGMQAGVVWTWEDQRRLGLLSFSGSGGECPIAEIVESQLSNGAAMQLTFAGLNPLDNNPVADAIALAVPLFAGGPGHLILLTGRNPDTCAQPNPQQGDSAAVVAAEEAFAAGLTTHVVEVGNINGGFAQALANAGAGLDPQGQIDAPFWEPSNTAGLAQDLDAILASVASCELILDQALAAGGELFCTLELDGMPVPLGDPEGWSVVAPERISLAGSACESLSQGATPALVCSCEAFEP